MMNSINAPSQATAWRLSLSPDAALRFAFYPVAGPSAWIAFPLPYQSRAPSALDPDHRASSKKPPISRTLLPGVLASLRAPAPEAFSAQAPAPGLAPSSSCYQSNHQLACPHPASEFSQCGSDPSMGLLHSHPPPLLGRKADSRVRVKLKASLALSSLIMGKGGALRCC